jgi:hypothetical protein
MLYYTRFITHFVALTCFIALLAALVVLQTRATKWCHKTRIINYTLSRAKNSGRQCHFKIWLDCHK